MAKSKFFRVAVEGATTDGRNIERSWIEDMGQLYNPDTYGARVNLEHFRGIFPDGPFKAYGDVVSAKSQEITEGALKGKLALLVQVDPTADLIKLSKAKQKVYPSIEVSPNFADTGRAYLVGLAITDSPASLGTEMMSFAAQHPSANPLASRKQDPSNLFTAATEGVEIELEDDPSDTAATTLFAAVKEKLAKLAGKGKTHDGQLAEVSEALQGVVETLSTVVADQAAASTKSAEQMTTFAARMAALETASAKHAGDFAALRSELSGTPDTPPRPAATGVGDVQLTDC